MSLSGSLLPNPKAFLFQLANGGIYERKDADQSTHDIGKVLVGSNITMSYYSPYFWHTIFLHFLRIEVGLWRPSTKSL